MRIPICVVLICCFTSAGAGRDLAQSPPTEDTGSSPHLGEAAEKPDGVWWHGLRGTAAPDRLYAGLWTFHLRDPSGGLSQQWLLALGWRGLMGGTFVNSHGDRSWAFGVAREVVTREQGRFGASVGYRLGVIRGYDERLHKVAGRWPVIPAVEVVGTVRHGRLGVTASYAGIVTSVGTFVTLGSR